MQRSILSYSKFVIILLTVMMFFSCDSGKDDSSSSNQTAPSNLLVSAEIVGKNTSNPNGDGTGMVKFNISAENATSYKISFGDGTTKDATTGTNSYAYKIAGTYSYIVTVTAFNGSKSIVKTVTVTVSVNTMPIWSDEFNVNGAPDISKWNYDLGSGGWGNNESQHYTNRSDNVIVENGVLKIIVKKEIYQGSNYTSARLKTQGKFSVQYGKIEFRAKLPAGRGTWPALWMLGDNISSAGWPDCGEIDVMEHKGNELNRIHGTLHFPGRSGGNPDTTSLIPNTTATTEFHTYAVDWRKEAIKFYIDDALFKTFPNSTNVPFNQKFFIIMNVAMGGSFGGAIDPSFVQSTMEVDYVRVYK